MKINKNETYEQMVARQKEERKELKKRLAEQQRMEKALAAQMTNERFQEMLAREERSKETEQRTQQELKQATELKNNMSQVAQQIAMEAIKAIPQEMQDEHHFVMEHLRNTNPFAHRQIEIALEQRNQQIAREIEERTQRFHHHHRHR